MIKRVLRSIILVVCVAGLQACSNGDTMKLLQNRNRVSAGPLNQYHMGRYTFKIPQEYVPQSYRFSLTPVQTLSDDRSYTYGIEIEELPWSSSDRLAEFEGRWRQSVKTVTVEREKSYAEIFGDGGKPYVQNLDASSFFDHKSVSICSTLSGYPYTIESFIALPQGIVRLEEKRGAGTPLTPACTNIESQAAALMKHYVWGKKPASQNDTFYTAMGRITGYASEKELASLTLRDEQARVLTIKSRYNSRQRYDPVLDRMPTKAEAIAQMGAAGQIVSHSERKVADRNMLEVIVKRKISKSAPLVLEFNAITMSSDTFTANRPEMSIRMLDDWDNCDQAVVVWNTVLNSLQHMAASER